MTARETLERPRRFFGWARNYQVPHEVEAAAIRQAAADLLAGTTTFTGLAHQWTADPLLHTVFGGPEWRPQVVERVIRRRSNAPLIIDRATHARLLHHLDDPATRLPPAPLRRARGLERITNAGVALLTQAAVCSVCGDRVTSKRSTSGGRTSVRYACRSHMRPDHPLRHDGVRHGSCDADALDAAVRAQMVYLLHGGEAAYDALSLSDRRALVRDHLVVTVHPAYTSPRFTITPRVP